jgi:endonuclease/exonuclease/phosphatase family metal-dependent hydrolase
VAAYAVKLRSIQEGVMAFSRIAPRSNRSSSIRVISFNILNTDTDWERRSTVISDGIHDLDPDIVAFQETVMIDGKDQVERLVDDGFHIVQTGDRDKVAMGISISSRWPIESHEEIDFHVTDRQDTPSIKALVAEIIVPEPFGRLIVVNHPPDAQPERERERELQTVRVAQRIEQRATNPEIHAVIVGDINAEPDSACIRYLTGKQSVEGSSVCYRSAWQRIHPGQPCHTYTPANGIYASRTWDWPFSQLDHILVRIGSKGQPTLNITACELAFDEPVNGIWGSDHIAVVADLTLPPTFP